MNEKISVFGGSGFIGSEFCKKYENESIIIDRDSLLPQTKKILYLISTVDNYNIFSDVRKDIETNLIHLVNVLENCPKDSEIIFISSWFVYGNTPDVPAKETSTCNPKGFYPITKYSAELLLESYCKTFGLTYKIIRLANVLGKTDNKVSKKKNALQFLLEELKNNNPIKLYNNGMFVRDYIHVDDVVEGIKFIVDHGLPNETYNLGSGNPNLFKDIIHLAKEKFKSTSLIGEMPPTDFHKIVQVENMYLNIEKLKNLGFTPKKDIVNYINEL
jgi:nucleoside-diphosphate-sugar epimerase